MKFTLELLTLALAALPSALADRTFVINNACPSDVPLFIEAEGLGTIPRGANVTKTFPSNFTGLIYSTANGGSGTGRLVTSARFDLDVRSPQVHPIDDIAHKTCVEWILSSS